MRHLKGYELFEQSGELTWEQREFLNETIRGKWGINKVGLIDVNGDFKLANSMETGELPVEFGWVSGNFFCGNKNLSSLKGSPRIVGGYFDCDGNELHTLEGAPLEVGGNFSCDLNPLTSLVGAPQKVNGHFSCENTQITTMIGAPLEVGGELFCRSNQINSLEGAPRKVGGDFYFIDNKVLPETLHMIFEKMQENPEMSYGVILMSLRNKIPAGDWEALDKSSIGEGQKRIRDARWDRCYLNITMRNIKKYEVFKTIPEGVNLKQKLWLDKVCIGSWKMNDQGEIDVNGSVDLKGDVGEYKKGEGLYGLKFGKITGDFSFGSDKNNSVTHLKGTPREIEGRFFLYGAQIHSLVDGPLSVTNGYQITSCELQSLDGCPKIVGTLDVEFNKIKNLEGIEGSKINKLLIGYNRINSLEGAPLDIAMDFSNNPVSRSTLEMIYSAMKENPELDYGYILSTLKSRIPSEDWGKLDKSAVDKVPERSRGGYGMLGVLGAI